jgi:hypothetical protein
MARLNTKDHFVARLKTKDPITTNRFKASLFIRVHPIKKQGTKDINDPK